VEADGSIMLERALTAPSQPLGARDKRADHVLYPVANPCLTATFENPGQISAYRVFGVGPILEPAAWRLSLRVDGGELAGYPPLTRVRGRLMSETWAAPDWQVVVTTFCDGERNILYQAYRIAGQDGPHTLEVAIRASFLAADDQGALHFDDGLGAAIAVLGQTALQAAWGRRSTVPGRTALIGADLKPAEWGVDGQRVYLTYRLPVAPHQEREWCLVLTGGWSRAEHEALFHQAVRGWREALAETHRYGEWLADRLTVDDPLLHSLFVATLHCALSAYREDHEGNFRGLTPSGDPAVPLEATFPCDAYWTSQVLLPFRPELVRQEILTLARAVEEDGRLGRSVPVVPDQGMEACDSPSYFALLVHDYLCWTGDYPLLEERSGGCTLWEKVRACVNYLRQRDTDHDFLFEKRREQPDWAEDVLRDDWVTYDLALHYQALKGAAEIALLRGEEEAGRDFADWATGAQRAINRRLWDEGRGYYLDYIRSYTGLVEDHVAVDTVVTALYGLASEGQSHRLLDRLAQTLETRHNTQQYYGDWGVMGCFPFYKERDDLTGRSAWCYSYHNGAAWPGWSGIYALASLLHRHGDWRYALERWWTYGLEQYWFTPVEYYAPPYDAPEFRKSALLYAWSSMAAAAMILAGFGFWPNLSGEVVLRVPPWGDSRLRGVRFRDGVYDVEARDGVVSIWRNSERIASDRHGLRIYLGRIAVRP